MDIPDRPVLSGSSHGLCRAGCRGPWLFVRYVRDMVVSRDAVDGA